MPPNVVVSAVRSRRQRRQWLRLPWAMNAGDPNWVPPLRHDHRRRAGFGRHPVWSFARREAWLATRGGEPVGRVAAIDNPAHNRRHGDRVGFFGFFDAADAEVACALLERAEQWLRDRGLSVSRGPMSPSMHYEFGVLVEGFDTPPGFLTAHNPPRYAGLLASAGYAKAHDAFAYVGDASMLDTYLANEKIAAVDRAVRERFGVRVRGMDGRRFDAELAVFLDLFNDAMGGQWGHTPMTPAEARAFASELRPLLAPELVRVAEVDGRPIGVMLGLLDYSPRIKAIDGRLLPFGFLRLLANKRALTRLRLVSTNVLPEFQSWGVGVCLARDMLGPALAFGVTECEFSWVLESNHLSRRTIEKAGARRSKTWRVFEKPLG